MIERISRMFLGLLASTFLVFASLGFAWAADEREVEGIYPYPGTPTHAMTFRYPASVQVGVDTVFSVSASGGVGDYKYCPYSLNVKNGTSWQPVVTFNMESFTPTNTSLTYNFSMVGTYQLRWSVMDRIADSGQWMSESFYTEFEVTGDGPSSSEREQLAADIAESAWQECKAAGCTTEYGIALWLHDWIIDHCTYDSSYLHYKPTDLFVDGRGTCEAYHGAYVQLLQKAGIQTARVEDAGHVWTGVRIDGVWCHVDTTSDDSDDDWFGLGDLNRHRFFGLDDATIEAKLRIDGGEIKRKAPDFTAPSVKNSYLVRSGDIRGYEDPFVGQIQDSLDKSLTSFDVLIPQTSMTATYKTLIYMPVAKTLEDRTWSSHGVKKELDIKYADDVLRVSVSSTGEETNPGTESGGAAKPASTPMHRLYNPNSGEHFYTASAYEKDDLARIGWRYEGIGWYAPKTGSNVYRLYNPNAGDHHYTTSASERDLLVRSGWNYEGVGWKSGGSVPLYRQYNPNALAGAHNFTTSRHENDSLVRVGWRAEGIAWYAVR